MTLLNRNPDTFCNFAVYLDRGAGDGLALPKQAERFAKKLKSLRVDYELDIYRYDTGIDWLDRLMSGHLLINLRLTESLVFLRRQFSRS